MDDAPWGHYCCPPRYWREPAYVRQLRRESTERGSVADAMAAVFARAGVELGVIGDVAVWARENQPVLLVADHRHRFEFAPLLATFGQLGRSDVHFIAKPYTRNARIMHATGPCATGMLLPVYPGTLAWDRAAAINPDLLRRFTLGDRLPVGAELRMLNRRSVARAGRFLAAGRVVTIYPTGNTGDALRARWYPGLGRVIRSLPESCVPKLHIVLVRYEDFSPAVVRSRLVAQSRGMTFRRTYRVTLRVGAQGAVEDILGSGAPIGKLLDEEVSERVRSRFIASFRRDPDTVF